MLDDLTTPWNDTRDVRPFAAEVKFLVDRALGQAIRRWALARLEPDPHASGPGAAYQTASLYFDADTFDVAHNRGSFGRSKYRVRRYGAGPVVFLERKLRRDGFLTKRRSVVSLADLARLEGTVSEVKWAGRWFHRRLAARQLRPVCHLTYERTALMGATAGGPMRLTIDEDVRAQPVSALSFVGGAGASVLDRHMILELKYTAAMPAVFGQLVAEFRLAPCAMSKYRLAARRLGLVSFAPQIESPTLTEASPS